jgi:hypothetical protein
MYKTVMSDINTRMPSIIQFEYQNIPGSGFAKADTVFHLPLFSGRAGNLDSK